ncbi:hypothetical protein C0J52_25488 [Blattella germanica]|nr:hypothetical protein C0J52_25488 [Blattella germanica]
MIDIYCFQATYPVLPTKGEAHLNFINTLPCQIKILNQFNNLQVINSTDNYVFYEIPVQKNKTCRFFIYTAKECGHLHLSVPTLLMNITVTEYKVDTIIITESKKKLNVIWSEPERLKKSLSGKPKIR